MYKFLKKVSLQIVCVLFVFSLFNLNNLFAQDRKLRTEIVKTSVKKRKQENYGMSSLILFKGVKQVDVRYVHISTGWGAEIGFAYVLTNKILLGLNSGFYSEQYKNVSLTRYAFQLNGKYKIWNLNNIFVVLGGVGFNGYIQNYDFISSSDPASFIWGPALFGELVVGLDSKLGLLLRVEKVMILNEKITLKENKEIFNMSNISLGLRMSF